jgi:hypothetical protein
MKNTQIFTLVAVLLGINLVSNSGSQDVPVPKTSDVSAAMEEARELLEDTPAEIQTVTPLFIPFDFDEEPPAPPKEEPEVQTVSEKYWDIMNAYRDSGGRPWKVSGGGRHLTGRQLLNHVAEHVSEDPYELSGWSDSELEYLHGWSHEMERNRASASGDHLMQTPVRKATSATTQNCPSGYCPNTRTWGIFK